MNVVDYLVRIMVEKFMNVGLILPKIGKIRIPNPNHLCYGETVSFCAKVIYKSKIGKDII